MEVFNNNDDDNNNDNNKYKYNNLPNKQRILYYSLNFDKQ